MEFAAKKVYSRTKGHGSAVDAKDKLRKVQMRKRSWFSLGGLALVMAVAVLWAPTFVAAQAQGAIGRGHEGGQQNADTNTATSTKRLGHAAARRTAILTCTDIGRA